MITFPHSRLQIWPHFCLNIIDEINLLCPGSYYLKGSNGSGKSSFINQVFLPIMRERTDLHLIVLQQQMHLQLYALRAWAAIYYPGRIVANETDVWELLWDDLTALKDDKPVFVVADEAHNIRIPEGLTHPVCLIYSSHNYQIQADNVLEFKPISPDESELRLLAEDALCAH
ncbi:MAG: hypothetical protein PHO85_06630 [Candidatus Cloacimonetes bacterium]|jgi:hypothetical protein|nr:hypothetical protein [Candidatus Cloacimonadota bacterium]MDD2506695.1 hypothetical protein [Candidatus Cloacimonadota bacterium]MDD4148177.1 hypothetical protein [Candidatus Cloacimonadota bacterium]MDD4560286.1 hypothetical protein [Candidatus Cloacimonadota bacterium]